MANGLRHTLSNFGHIVNFACAKELLEPMRPIVCALQGELIEVYFGFQKIEEVIFSYQEIRNEIDTRFQLMYEKVKTLAEMVGSLNNAREFAVDKRIVKTVQLKQYKNTGGEQWQYHF